MTLVAERKGAHFYPDGADRCERCGLRASFVAQVKIACPGKRIAGEDYNDLRAGFHDHVGGWQHFSLQQLVEAGVLQLITRDSLWPLGLALMVTVPSHRERGERDYSVGQLCIVEPVPLNEIVSSGVDRSQAYVTFVEQRRAAIEERDAE
jgi:hypothetical protein